MISYSTKNINAQTPYYEDISLILSRHRGQNLRAEILNEENPATLLLYVVDGRAVSSLRYFPYKNCIYVNLVHTLEEFRGKGYSRALFEHLFTVVDKPVMLEVEADNKVAIRLYERLGFKPSGFNSYGDMIMYWGSNNIC